MGPVRSQHHFDFVVRFAEIFAIFIDCLPSFNAYIRERRLACRVKYLYKKGCYVPLIKGPLDKKEP
jgi:hypothetical protein